ncbi:MAG: nucleotide exchange factor GrpE [bacterium]|nr:nucleotide exchange factor GrpE [bacterium]
MKEEDDIEIDRSDLDDSVVEEESAQVAIKKLREKLKEAEAKAKEYLDGWQRAQADFANLRRRDEEAKFEFIKFAKLTLIEELIPVLDSFNIALAHASTSRSTLRVSDSMSSAQVTDIKPIYDQFFSILKQNGLEELNPMDEVFNPKYHEAIGVVLTDESEKDHKIFEVMQKGYILIGKIIRPAKVKIGEYHG